MKNYCELCHQADDHVPPQLVIGTPSAIYPDCSQTCSACSRKIILIDIKIACQITRKSRKTMYAWIKKGLVTTLLLADMRQLVVYSSLFLPKPEPDMQLRD